MVWVNKLVHGEEAIGQYVMFANRSAIPEAVADELRALIWKHTVVYPYQRGDVVILDNFRIAHGRQPYVGPRTVYVTWGGHPESD